MSLRLQLLQVARLAPRLLGDSTDLVREFFRSQLKNGAGIDRSGRLDLYYTIFTLAGMQALDVPVPMEQVREYLLAQGQGTTLDFTHLSALARSWAVVGTDKMPPGLKPAILQQIERYRKPDGGYEGNATLRHGTAYGAFVALGAYQDLGETPPDPLKLARALAALQSEDGAWSNVPGMKQGALNATAGAVTLLTHLGFPVRSTVAQWLLHQEHPEGGFKAIPNAPIPDLLSTATALHALACLNHRLPSALHERCLNFIDTLWNAGGGFHGHWADDHLDSEYTFYGLLALGHLSL